MKPTTGFIKSNVPMDRPLQGIRVVEVAMWVAGPSTTAVLGDWGADVVNLEDPTMGYPIRGFVHPHDCSIPMRASVRRSMSQSQQAIGGRRLRTVDGHAFALKLIERADVFVTSLRLDAIERMKLDDAMRRRKVRAHLCVAQRLWASRAGSQSPCI